MHKPSTFRDYVIASLMAGALVAFFSLYLFIRRGYLFDAPPTADTLYVFNKVLIGAGTILLALTFLIGPIVRYFDRLDAWLGYRKEIGIVGALLAVSHGLISYFLLPLKFPASKLDFTSLTFAAGLIGAFLLAFLFIISFKKAIDLLGGSRWWFLQRWGLRLVIALTLIHVYVMKWDGWMKWLKQGGVPTAELAHPLMPGLGMLVTLFLTWVVIVRLYESVFLFKDFGITTKEISIDPILKARGRRFLLSSFSVLVVLYAIVFFRFVTP